MMSMEFFWGRSVTNVLCNVCPSCLVLRLTFFRSMEVRHSRGHVSMTIEQVMLCPCNRLGG